MKITIDGIEASDTNTILGTAFFFRSSRTRYCNFAKYDGTICGSNATGYFIVTNCNAPHNEVTLDVTAKCTNKCNHKLESHH